MGKNSLTADRVREDPTENTGLELGHETNVGCQEAENRSILEQ